MNLNVLTAILLWGGVPGVIGAYIAPRKGWRVLAGLALCVVLGFIGLIYLALLPDVRRGSGRGGSLRPVLGAVVLILGALIAVFVNPILGLLILLVEVLAVIYEDRDAAPAPVQPTSIAAELARFADLHDRGALTDEEFQAQKSRPLHG